MNICVGPIFLYPAAPALSRPPKLAKKNMAAEDIIAMCFSVNNTIETIVAKLYGVSAVCLKLYVPYFIYSSLTVAYNAGTFVTIL